MKPKDAPKGPVDRKIPPGDNRERLVCNDCGFIFYDNPKLVVGAVVEAEDGKILLCRRAIEPGHGLWTIPAGFMELGETPHDGALREAQEEACATIAIDALLAIYSIPRISQVQMIYRARLVGEDFGVGVESLEVKLFAWDDIPWEKLAFPTVHWALVQFDQMRGKSDFAPLANPLH
ncbi:MAG: NUDIX hydrolase [Deltaproteobacteria bacterium]|nr:NUDIX hydrolase [Deltaproteobacteria bacterium]